MLIKHCINQILKILNKDGAKNFLNIIQSLKKNDAENLNSIDTANQNEFEMILEKDDSKSDEDDSDSSQKEKALESENELGDSEIKTDAPLDIKGQFESLLNSDSNLEIQKSMFDLTNTVVPQDKSEKQSKKSKNSRNLSKIKINKVLEKDVLQNLKGDEKFLIDYVVNAPYLAGNNTNLGENVDKDAGESSEHESEDSSNVIQELIIKPEADKPEKVVFRSLNLFCQRDA